MRKNSNQVSQSKIKRSQKTLNRKVRKSLAVEEHVNWLEHLVMAGVEIDIEKLMYKGKEKNVMNMRDPKLVNLILSKLTSRVALKVKK
jgi:hypothetical protein